MRQAGGSIAADDTADERARAWVDFGVDETWELVRSRRRPATPARGTADTPPRVVESTLSAGGAVHAAPMARSPRSMPAGRSAGSVAPAERSARSRSAGRSPRSVAPAGRSPRSVAPAPAPHEFVPLRSPRSLTELPDAPTASRTPAPVGVVTDATGATHAPVGATRAPAGASRARADATRADTSRARADATRADASRARADVTRARGDATPSVRGVPPRRTVTIRGRGAERELAFPTDRPVRRPATRRHERPGFRPDRMAMWAVVLGILLLLVAVTSSHAAVLAHVVH